MVFLLALAAALLMGAADAEALTRVVVSDTGEELWVALPNVVRHNPRARRLSSTSTPTPAVRANGTHAADDHAPNACDAQPGGGHGAAPAHNDHTDGLFFLFVVSCTLGYMWRKLESILSHVHINRKLCPCGAYLLPYTVLLLFSGMVIGWVHRFWLCPAGILDSFGGLGHSINKWRTINPHYVLYLFLPPLIFASAHHVDYHVISRSIVHIGYLATVGVVISAILTALVAKYCFWWYEFNWWTALTFGSMLAATDPVAVVALLADLGAPKTLSLLIEGESLFNDGTAYVFFMLFMRFMKGEVMGWYSIPLYFVQLAFGGMAIGWVVGKVMNFLLKHTTNATSEIMITITCAYSTFILAEACGTSGVLAVVLLGFTMAKGGQAYVTNREALEVFWEETELLANTMIFAISGVIMTTNIDLGSMFRDYKVEEGTVPNDLHGGDVVFLIILYISAIAIRFLSTFSLYALDITVLRNLKWPRCCRCIAFDIAEYSAAYPTGRAPPATAWHRLRQSLKPSKYRLVREYDMTWQVAVVTSWGGLRGAVGLCLAMMVSQEFGSEFGTENSLAPLGPKFMFHMSGIAFLTLVLNGSTAGALVHALGLVTAPPEAKVAWHGVTQELHTKLKELIHELKSDPMYRWANWDEVLQYLPTFTPGCKDDLDGFIEQLYAFEEHEGSANIKRNVASLNAAYLAKVESRFVAPKLCRCCLRCKSNASECDTRAAGGGGGAAAAATLSAAAAAVPAAVDPIIDPHDDEEAMDAIMWPYLIQARERFINLVVAAYWDELEEGKVSDRSFNMLRHATDVVRDKIRYHRTAPEEEEERSASGLSEWTTVEGLTVNHFLHFLMGALDHGPLKKIVHLRTAMYWDLVIDISTTFIDVHQKVLDEFKEGLSAIQKTDIATPRDYMRDTAITEGVIREAEFDLALAHRIFESVPHTSIIGRHSLTSICIRHIHKMCEKQCKKVFEEGELNESEFDLLMWGIARCESKHAWRMPGACAKEANLQLMLKKNLSKAMYEDPERSARMIEAIRTDGKRKDFLDEVIFEQLSTPGELSRGGKSRWGVYIILEGAVTVSRGREVPDDETCAALPEKVVLNEDEEEAVAATTLGGVEAGGESDGEEESKPAATQSAVGFADDARAADAARRGAAAVAKADAAPSGANKSVRFNAVDAETIGDEVRSDDGAAEDSEEDGGVLRHTAISRASLAVQRQKSRPKSRLLTPHYKHRMHRMLRGKECKTHLHVEDSHTIELFKGSGHVCGMLSVLTGHPRYIKLSATGPVTAAFINADVLLDIFKDEAEERSLIARNTGVAPRDQSGFEVGLDGAVRVANPMANRSGALNVKHTTSRASLMEVVGPALTGSIDNPGAATQRASIHAQRVAPTISLDERGRIVFTRESFERSTPQFDGVAVDAWYDYRVGTNEVRARDAAAAGAKANGTPWELHDVSPLEREFCLEAAVTAAQIFMRLSADNGGNGDRVVGTRTPTHEVHPEQSQALLLGVGAVLGSYPAFEHGLAAYFEARHFDPESVDFARPILERATVLMPSQAVLPCIITLTHPCILLDGRLWIVSSPPSGGGDRRKESSSGLGSDSTGGGGGASATFAGLRNSIAAGVHRAPASATTHGSAVFDIDTGCWVSSFGAITSPALIVASPDCPVRVKVDVAAAAASSPHTSPAGAAETVGSDDAAAEGGGEGIFASRSRGTTPGLSKPPTAPRLVVLPEEDTLAEIIGEIVSKKTRGFAGSDAFQSGRRSGGRGGGHGGAGRDCGRGSAAHGRGSLVNPVTGAATATATTPRKVRRKATTMSIDLRHHADYRRSVDRLIARDLTADGIEEARLELQQIYEAGH